MRKERVYFQVHFDGDPSGFGGCYSKTFGTIEEAKKEQQEMKERNTGDGYDAYWNKMPSVIEKETVITETIKEENKNVIA